MKDGSNDDEMTGTMFIIKSTHNRPLFRNVSNGWLGALELSMLTKPIMKKI